MHEQKQWRVVGLAIQRGLSRLPLRDSAGLPFSTKKLVIEQSPDFPQRWAFVHLRAAHPGADTPSLELLNCVDEDSISR